MKHQDYDWQSKDNKNIYAQSWAPDHHPSAVINIIHAFGEHSGRYQKWAGLFVEKGGMSKITRSFLTRLTFSLRNQPNYLLIPREFYMATVWEEILL
jgi:hypothetical protein